MSIKDKKEEGNNGLAVLAIAALGAAAVYFVNKEKAVNTSGVPAGNCDLPKFKEGDIPGPPSNLNQVNFLHPAIRQATANFLKQCYREGHDVIITMGKLEDYEHNLFQNDGILTEDWLGSYHDYGLCFDFQVGSIIPDPYGAERHAVLLIALEHGFDTGTDHLSYLDNYHLENVFGHNIHQLRNKFNAGQTCAGYVMLN